MNFEVKLMNKPLENGKQPTFRPDFGLFTQNLELPQVFLEFYFDEFSNIVWSYSHIQVKVKLMKEDW